ncbi:GntR family transcriptional regulator [Listeria monocytogenes]|uniref:GntR family transcriptional regulator n=1 Tax=Listeria monocytogenes TaxID=1639 RepID=A0A5Y1MS25_LISMN|nr:GntR family transcriptional regulator [Listeria monocytogenes]EEP3930332.1 GntR family transcriptional regulator [Listeria monocytogenes serotype 4ab]MCY62179.1 GntR family transcriptional regulator [Listeria monocytogenes serotype 4c]MDA20150.1 GntR family transcriptional regulator [Listeria monocytogenes serotype 4a]EAC2402523.1 GntR family transcriptional regulator [Listeria monocytogenes]EAC3359046.1 GntR family transcriptional regulator [Listeria monocytogenes]
MFTINTKSQLPIYEQIVQKIKEQVVKGILREGEKILSIREFASRIGVNPNTVSKAYQELERQEVIVTVKGKGTFIANQEDKVSSPKKLAETKIKLKETILDLVYLGINVEEIHRLSDEYSKDIIGGDMVEG